MAITWPTTPDVWLVDYTAWRINSGKLATRPPTVPPDVPLYADEFTYWAIWRRKGRPTPRPTGFPAADDIPKIWPYQVLDAVNAKAPIQIPGDTTCPHAWVLTWAIWRFKNEPDPKPPSIPKDPSYVAPYIWSFLNWAAWKRKQVSVPSTPRPKNLPEVIPDWCWKHLNQINQAVSPGDPPPPPPPPPPPGPANTWTLPYPFMTVAWGPLSDSQYRDNSEAYTRMRDAGVKTIGFQIAGGEPLFEMTAVQRARALGLKIALWGTAHPRDNELIALSRADGYMPQVETPDEYNLAIANFEAGYGQGIARSVFTTLYGFNNFVRRAPNAQYPQGQLTTAEYERMRPYCTHMLVECYVQDGGAHFPLSKMMWSALEQRGADYANPAIGLWNETDMSVYLGGPDELGAYGRQIGVYLAEGMTPKNWVDLKTLAT